MEILFNFFDAKKKLPKQECGWIVSDDLIVIDSNGDKHCAVYLFDECVWGDATDYNELDGHAILKDIVSWAYLNSK